MKRKRYPLSKTARKLLSLMQDWGGECPVAASYRIFIGDHRQICVSESLNGLERNGLMEWGYWPTLGCITEKGKQALARGWR